LLPVQQPQKLSLLFPIPPRVAHMHEPFVLDFPRDFAQRRERVRIRRTFWPELFFFRQPKRANSGENFQPRQKEPAHRRGPTYHPAASDEINSEKTRDENTERARLLRI